MKFFYRKFLTVFLILLFAFYAKAVNDTLTIRQAFDLKVGDTLVYTGWENGQFFGNQNVYQQPWGMTIINRLEFSDTIDFTYQILGVGFVAHLILTHLDSTTDVHADFGSYNRNSFFGFHGGCFLNTFASTMQGCDTNATYCQTYNGTEPSFFNRITAVNQISFFEGGLSIKFLQGVGIFSGSSGGDGYIVIWPNYFSGSCNMQLIYYHSDSLTWGSLPTGFDEVISTNPTFRLFPNPTSDELTITTEAEGTYSVSVYDVMGNCVSTPKNFSNNLFHIKVKHLPVGYYYLKVTDEHFNSTTKSFVIVR